jgi:hypothetical protein
VHLQLYTLRTAPAAQRTSAANTKGSTGTTKATKTTGTTIYKGKRGTQLEQSCLCFPCGGAPAPSPNAPFQLFRFCCFVFVLSFLTFLVSFGWCKDHQMQLSWSTS